MMSLIEPTLHVLWETWITRPRITRKLPQILESLARKWNTPERNELATVATWLMQRDSITQTFYNSNFFWWSAAVRVIQVSLYMGNHMGRFAMVPLLYAPPEGFDFHPAARVVEYISLSPTTISDDELLPS